MTLQSDDLPKNERQKKMRTWCHIQFLIYQIPNRHGNYLILQVMDDPKQTETIPRQETPIPSETVINVRKEIANWEQKQWGTEAVLTFKSLDSHIYF